MSNILANIQMHDTIVQFLDSIKDEPQLSQRIIGAMPNEIHTTYVTEKNVVSKRYVQ